MPALRGPTSLLRLQNDERLIALTRRGNEHAYGALVGRYESRLLAFCRHMLGSREDAEDVLQEVFAAAFNAIVADERPINVRPWLYRIARNRSLNHLRRQQAIGVDSMDVHLAEHGTTTADKVHRREEFRQLMADVGELPETQRTALLLREIDALSYEQIAEAMETTVPSVKSLLVRARVSLAEAAEARKLTCAEVRLELAEVAEGLAKTSAPVRRHLRGCDRCRSFRRQLRETNRALALMLPVTPLLMAKKVVLAHLGSSASAGGAGVAAGGAGAMGAGTVSAGLGAVAAKAAAGLAAAALVTAGAVEVDHSSTPTRHPSGATVERTSPTAVLPAQTQTPVLVARSTPEPDTGVAPAQPSHSTARAAATKHVATTPTPTKTTATTPTATTTTPTTTTEEGGSTVVLPPQDGGSQTTTTSSPPPSSTTTTTTPSGDGSQTTTSPSGPPPSGGSGSGSGSGSSSGSGSGSSGSSTSGSGSSSSQGSGPGATTVPLPAVPVVPAGPAPGQ